MKMKICLNNDFWSLADELNFVYESYGQEDDNKLDDNAIKLKKAINELIMYLDVQGFVEYEKLEEE